MEKSCESPSFFYLILTYLFAAANPRSSKKANTSNSEEEDNEDEEDDEDPESSA